MPFRQYIVFASKTFSWFLVLGIFTFSLQSLFEDPEDCLARNIWFEASGEPYDGQRAVGIVTALRTISGEYPRSVCKTVYQDLQFSWTLDPAKVTEIISDPHFQNIRRLARVILDLRKDPEVLRQAAQSLGIPPDGYFYKRADNVGVSARGKKFFDECTIAVLDPKDPTQTKQLVIGNHGFHRPRPGGCIDETRETVPLPERKPPA